MEDKFFPLFINLTDKKVLVIGAGKIAYRKIQTILEYGAKIEIITQKINDPRFFDLKDIKIHIGDFNEKMLEDVFMVVCATNNPYFNKTIVDICNKKNILVNNITSKDEMNCRFGSLLELNEYQIAISAKGDPTKSKNLRDKIRDFLTSFFGKHKKLG